jgi:PAS domain S-box-containing protein
MKFLKMGSIGRSLVLLVMLAVLPALLVILLSGLEQRRHAIDTARLEVLSLARTMAEVQHGITRSTRQTLATLANIHEIQGLEGRSSSEIFRSLIEQNPDFLNISATDANGNVFASAKAFVETSLADRRHVREALLNKDFAAGEYVITRVGVRAPSFAFAYPFSGKDGEIKGVLTSALGLGRFAQLFDVAALPPDSFMAVTDHQGRKLFQYPSDESMEFAGQLMVAEAWQAASEAAEPGTVIISDADGVRRIIAFTQVRLETGGSPYMYMWVGVPESRTLKHADSVLARNLLLMALAIVLALAISWVIGRTTLISPVNSLLLMTRNLARGDYRARSGLAKEPGELGRLAKAFDEMADTLNRNQETLRTIANYTYDWEYWVGADGVLKWVSPSCEKVTGYTDAEFMADQDLLARIVHLEDAALFANHLERVRTEGEPTGNFDFRIIHRSGGVIWINHRCLSIFRPDGTSLGRRVSNRDITQRKQIEEEREKLQIQLTHAQKMESVGRLAGGVAHDFNNMLSVILGYTELAMRSHPTGEIHAELQEIEKAARRSADIVRQLLAFARQQTVAPKPLNLNDTVESMLKMLRRLIGEDIDVAWRPAADLWLVKIDSSQVDQLLANMCVNARDAIAGVGRVTIETENVTIDEAYCVSHVYCAPGEYVMLAISDDGCGMEREILANIFDPFFTTKDLGRGTGLGLATVYGIVKQNQGFINVYSEPEQGTTLKIYLPRLIDPSAAAVQAINKLDIPLGQGETVLLVEDEPAVMLIGSRMLQYLGYKVVMAETPKEALRVARDGGRGIKLLLTDVVMPEMNGRELATELVSFNPGLKCLFMSGYTANVIAHRGVLYEGVRFLQKPFSLKDLAWKLREVLDDEGS